MARRVHRTARGQVVDMESLRLANDGTIAVGNMKVNARTKKEVMDETYKVHTMVPQDDTVYRDAEESEAVNIKPTSSGVETVVKEEPTPTVEGFVAPKEEPVSEPQVMRGGLAAALAKKVEMSEPDVTPSGINSGESGVKRI